MTIAVLIVGGILAGLYATFVSFWLVGDITVFVLLFGATLLTATAFAFRSHDRAAIIGAAVLITNFILSLLIWQLAPDPTLLHGILNLVTAGWFLTCGDADWEFLVGFVYLAAVLAGVLTFVNVIPDHTERANQFVSLSFPDINAILGHVANICLGMAAGDSGLAIRRRLQARALVGGLRRTALARVLGLSPLASDEGEEG